MSENGTSGSVYTGKVKKKFVGSYREGIVYNLSGENVCLYGNGSIAPYGGAGLLGSYKDGVIYTQYQETVGYYRNGKLYDKNNELIGSYSGDDAGGAAGCFSLIITGQNRSASAGKN